MFADLNLFLSAEGGFFKTDSNIHTKVRTSSLSLSSTAAEEITKYVAELGENIIEAAKSVKPSSL